MGLLSAQFCVFQWDYFVCFCVCELSKLCFQKLKYHFKTFSKWMMLHLLNFDYLPMHRPFCLNFFSFENIFKNLPVTRALLDSMAGLSAGYQTVPYH